MRDAGHVGFTPPDNGHFARAPGRQLSAHKPTYWLIHSLYPVGPLAGVRFTGRGVAASTESDVAVPSGRKDLAVHPIDHGSRRIPTPRGRSFNDLP